MRSIPQRWRLGVGVVLACALVGAAVGILTKPPGGIGAGSEPRVGVFLTPVNQRQLVRAHVPTSRPLPPLDVDYWRGQRLYGGFVFGTGLSVDEALNRAVVSALDYTRLLTSHENGLMRHSNPPERIRRLQDSVLREPSRYAIQYLPPARQPEAGSVKTAGSFTGDSWRGALVGALVGLLLLGVGRLAVARRLLPATVGGSSHDPTRHSPTAAVALLAGLGLVALVVAAASASTTSYNVVLVGLMFSCLFAFARVGGRPALRFLVGAVIVLSALRGAILGLTNSIHLADGLTTVNAIQPAIVAACALAVLVERRGRFPRDTRPLLVGWALIAGVSLLDLATETVGYHVYAIGLAQYLTYPTLAILAWLARERGDTERVVRLFILLGAVVAVSVFVEAAGLVRFVEAAAPNGDPGVGNRYGGATGSYLHASIFMGTAAILAMGVVLDRWRRREGMVAAGVLAMMVGAMALTLSRGGFVIAGIGGLVLLVAGRGSERRRLIAAGVAAVSVALILGALGGVTPGKLGSRLNSGFSASGDPGNKLRIDRWHRSVDRFENLSAAQKGFGEGLAATGNARVVASLKPVATESYPLKLLLEVGIIGALVIGAYLLWAVIRFGATSIRGPTWLVRSLAAAGLGLSLYGLVYPTLEVQLLAMTWWLLLVACLAAVRVPRHEAAPAQDSDGASEARVAERLIHPALPGGGGGRLGADRERTKNP